MKKKTFDSTDRAIIKSISFILGFAALVLLIIAALYLNSTKGEFLSAFKLDYTFYLPALVTLFGFSVIFAPFSYGVSNYIIKSKNKASFADVFYLFKSPSVLFKAIAVDILRRVLVNISRLLTIGAALILECTLFVVTVILSGENVFKYEQDFLKNVSEFVMGNSFFAVATVIGWIIVLCLVFYFKIKYILCKYVLIINPLVGVIEAVRIGRYCIRGKVFTTVLFYFKYLSVYIFTFISGGKFAKTTDTFSGYAIKIVKEGMQRYFYTV